MKNLRPKLPYIVGAILIVLLAGFGVYKYVSLLEEVKKLRTSSTASQDEIKKENAKLIEDVKKRISVPDDETPTIATVTDAEKLKNNQFFINAQNGDKVLIYSKIKKAILYRPSDSKVIEVGPVNIGTPSASLNATVNFALYNGTSSTGLTKSYEDKLKQAIKNAVILSRDNAAKRDYAKSVLVDLTGNQPAIAAEYAKALGVEVGPLPSGEKKPSGAEFLIILGEDKK